MAGLEKFRPKLKIVLGGLLVGLVSGMNGVSLHCIIHKGMGENLNGCRLVRWAYKPGCSLGDIGRTEAVE